VIARLVPSLVPRMLTYTMVAGTMITSNQSGILSIGKALASTVGKGAGQTLLLDGYNYSIAGVYQTNAWMDYSLIIPHSVAQQLIGWVNQTSMIVVTTQDPRTVDTIIGQIRTLLPTTDAFRTSEAPSKISPIFASLEAIASDITIIVSLSAVLGILNSNLNNLRERMRTFAIFKATGASSSQIISLVLYEYLQITRGKLLTVCGPSGSGKTTLLFLLGGLDKPTSGRIYFEGVEVSNMNERRLSKLRRKSFGFVFQNYNLVDELTVLENVMLTM